MDLFMVVHQTYIVVHFEAEIQKFSITQIGVSKYFLGLNLCLTKYSQHTFLNFFCPILG